MTQPDTLAWPHGDSELTKRVRAHDWAATPVGPVETWPERLRVVVELVLASPILSSVAVGPQRLLIYNDAAAHFYGERHPAALGQPLAETFPESFPSVAPLYDRVFAGEAVTVAAQPLDMRQDGVGEVFDAYLTPVFDPEGTVLAAHMIGMEVGARERARRALEDSEERYRAFVTASADVVYRMSPDWAQMRQLDGRGFLADTSEESEDWRDRYILPADRDRVEAAIREAVSAKSMFELEHRVLLADGTIGWTHSRAVPILDDDGEIYEWLGAASNVTARRGAEVRLRESEERQAFLLKLSDALRSLLEEGEIERTAARLLGEHFQADRCFLSPVYDDGTGMCVREEFLRGGASSVLGDYTFAQFGDFVGPELHAGRILAVDDVDALTGLSSAERESYEATGIGAYLLIPLVRDGRLAAFLTINHQTPRPWSDSDKAVARQTADRLWMARERGRVERELRESEERQAFLLKLSDALRPLDDAAEIMRTAVRLLGETIGANRAFYGAIDADGDTGHIYAVFADGLAEAAGTYSLAAFAPKLVPEWQAGRVTVTCDVDTDPLFTEVERAAYAALEARAAVGVPLVKGGRLRALFGVSSAGPREWAEPEIALMTETAERTWAAVERARAEAELRESETRYRTLFNSMDQGFCVVEVVFDQAETPVDYVFVETNPAFVGQTGLTDAVGRGARELIPGHEEFWFETYGRIARTGIPERFEHYADALGRWYNVYAFRIGAPDQHRVAMLFDDIAPRKHAEQVLRESEERQSFLLKLSDALQPLVDPDAIKDAATQVLGEHLDVLRAQYWEADANAEYLESAGGYANGVAPVTARIRMDDFGEYVKDSYRAGKIMAVADVAADPRVRPDELKSYEALGFRAWAGVPLVKGNRLVAALGLHNATRREWSDTEIELARETAERTWAAVERVRAETMLRESEERFRQFGDASQDVLWIRDAEMLQWTYLTPAFEAIYGVSREEALAGENYRSWLELVVPEDRAHAAACIERVRQGEWVTFEYRVQRPKDGDICWLRNTDFPIRDGSGRVTHVGGIGHDVSALKRADLLLAAAEQRQRSLVEGIPQLVWSASDAGRWTWASPQWTAYTGQPEADSHGWGWLDVIHPDDREAARAEWARATDAGRFEAEYRVRNARDGYHWFQSRATPVRDEVGAIVEWIGTSTDVNNLRQLQERQKVMVAELQHRTRNLITVVSALSHQTMKNAGSLGEFDQRFGDRLSALSRVQGLLSHLSAGKRVAFDVLLRSELTALGAPDEKLTLDGPSGVPLRSATVQTFSLALHELATNALKYGALSVPDGHLTVLWEMTNAAEEGPRLHVHWRETGVTMAQVGGSPRGTGYGRELIERALPYQMDAETTYEMTADGVHCTIEVPVSTVKLGTDHEVEHSVA